MAKIVKIGEHASFFYDPTSKVQLVPGEVIELNKRQEHSKKIKKALQGGHLVLASKEEVEAFKNGEPLEKEVDKNWLESFDPTDSKAVSKLKNDELKELIKYTSDEEYDEDDFDDMKKADLIAELEEVLNS